MNNEQEKKLIRYMHAHDLEDMETVAAWATIEFGFPVSARECRELFINSLCLS